MPQREFRPALAMGAAVLAVTLATAVPHVADAAETCRSKPDVRAEGGHWYYRVDRPTNRRCWYQTGQQGTAAAPTAAATGATSTNTVPAAAGSQTGLGAVFSNIAAKLKSTPADASQQPQRD